MFLKYITGLGILFILSLSYGEDTIVTLNEKNLLNTVDDNFISFTVDPAILLTELNISSNSKKLAQHLKPAYIRIGGPSTQFIKYVDDNSLTTKFDNETMTWSISRPMWAVINGWILNTNLTSVFSIGDNIALDQKSLLQLLNYTDQLNISTYWHIDYSCNNKNVEDYFADLASLHKTFQSFPNKSNTWKLIGGDLSKCFSQENIQDVVQNYDNITAAILLEPSNQSMETMLKRRFSATEVPLWITAPKYLSPIVFSDGILWAKQIGDAAAQGYKVIFRQPRVRELFYISPIYWISLLHKRLMGPNVLEVKTAVSYKDKFLYSHCKKVETDLQSNTLTFLFINNGTTADFVYLNVSTIRNVSVEIQSYILTSTSDISNDVYLNGKMLLFEDLDEEESFLKPNVTASPISSILKINLPSKSVGFFVLPQVSMPACNNLHALKHATEDDDFNSFDVLLSARIGDADNSKHSVSLNDLHKLMVKELEADELFYKKAIQKNQNLIENWKKLLMDRVRDVKSKKLPKNDIKLDKPQQELRIANSNRVKLAETNKMTQDSNKIILGRNKNNEKKNDFKKALLNDLTSAEVEKILESRQKNKEYERIKLSSTELDDIFSRLVKRLKNNANKNKRAINMDLLNMHTKDSSNEDISLNNKFKELGKELIPKMKAKSVDENKSLKGSLSTNAAVASTKTTTERVKDNSNENERLQFKTALNSFESIEDSLDDHAFYEKLGFTVIQSKPSPKELFEADIDDLHNDKELDEDVQAFVKKNNKDGLLKLTRNKQKFNDLILPKSEAGIDDFDMFEHDLDPIFKYKRSPRSLVKRIRRDSILDKLNIKHDNILENLLSNKIQLKPFTEDDHLLKLKSILEGDVIEDIKEKLQNHRDKIQEQNEEILQKIEEIKSQIRLPRSLKNNMNIKNVDENTREWYKYKPQRASHQEWKPERLILKGKLLQKKKTEARKKLNEQLLQQKVVRLKRSDLDTRENEIESNENYINIKTNSILKDKSYPKMNYISNDEGLKQNLKNFKMKALNEKEEFAIENGTAISSDVISYGDDPATNRTVEQLQRINVNFKPSFFQRMFEVVAEFFNDMEQKFSYYFLS